MTEITQEDVEKWLKDNPDLAKANTTGITPAQIAELGVGLGGFERWQLSQDRQESETSFQQRVIKFLHGNSWKVLVTGVARIRKGGKDTYVTPYRADGKGFCDIFAVHSSGKMLALEIKSRTGKASPEQVEWLLALSKCGAITHVVTPDNWPEIQKIISEVNP